VVWFGESPVWEKTYRFFYCAQILMSEPHKLNPEDHDLLRVVLRRRQPSSLWLISSMDQKPLTPAHRENIKSVLNDELRETGYSSDKADSLKKLIDFFGQS
jgi:hypothetical protein